MVASRSSGRHSMPSGILLQRCLARGPTGAGWGRAGCIYEVGTSPRLPSVELPPATLDKMGEHLAFLTFLSACSGLPNYSTGKHQAALSSQTIKHCTHHLTLHACSVRRTARHKPRRCGRRMQPAALSSISWTRRGRYPMDVAGCSAALKRDVGGQVVGCRRRCCACSGAGTVRQQWALAKASTGPYTASKLQTTTPCSVRIALELPQTKGITLVSRRAGCASDSTPSGLHAMCLRRLRAALLLWYARAPCACRQLLSAPFHAGRSLTRGGLLR